MRAIALSLVVVSSFAAAQVEPTAPPIVTTPEEQSPPQVVTPANPPLQPEVTPPPAVDPTYVQRCFAVPGQVWIPMPTGHYYFVSASSTAPLSSFHEAQPASGPSAPTAGSATGGNASGGGGNEISGKAILVLAVVLVAALPIVVYVIDDDAPAVVAQRFHCPSFGFDAVGGVDFGPRNGATGGGSGRFTFGYAYFGSDFQFDLSAGAINSWAGHVLLRIAPKKHIEPNIAFGFRTMSVGGSLRQGFELGVPHRYVFTRDGLRQLSLELRPTFMFGLGTLDVGLEAALIVPLVEPLHFRVGGRVQSFGEEIIGGMNAGLSLNL